MPCSLPLIQMDTLRESSAPWALTGSSGESSRTRSRSRRRGDFGAGSRARTEGIGRVDPQEPGPADPARLDLPSDSTSRAATPLVPGAGPGWLAGKAESRVEARLEG